MLRYFQFNKYRKKDRGEFHNIGAENSKDLGVYIEGKVGKGGGERVEFKISWNIKEGGSCRKCEKKKYSVDCGGEG